MEDSSIGDRTYCHFISYHFNWRYSIYLMDQIYIILPYISFSLSIFSQYIYYPGEHWFFFPFYFSSFYIERQLFSTALSMGINKTIIRRLLIPFFLKKNTMNWIEMIRGLIFFTNSKSILFSQRRKMKYHTRFEKSSFLHI